MNPGPFIPRAMPPRPGMPAPWGTVLVLSCAVAATPIKTKKSTNFIFIATSLLHSIEFYGQMLTVLRSHQPHIIFVLNGGIPLHHVQVAVLRLRENPGLVLQSLWMAGLQHEFLVSAAQGPLHVTAGIQKFRQAGHGVPAEAALAG